MKPINPLYLQTFSGKQLHFRDPHPDEVVIEDIARGLSHNCRFSGQLSEFLSVARHSINLMNYVSDRYEDPAMNFLALMHDATEAYYNDLPAPIKQFLPEYKKMEDKLQEVIFQKFGIEYSKEAWMEMKAADRAMAWAEGDLLAPHWSETFYYDDPGIIRYAQKDRSPMITMQEFLYLFNEVRKNLIAKKVSTK